MARVAQPIRIYVGADRSQLLGVRVLEHSIRRHTNSPVEVTPMVDLPLPAPPEPKHQARTGFSFARFAIPALAGFKGRAIYLDADMLVFCDIAELWDMPFGEAKVICQEEFAKANRFSFGLLPRSRVRKKQCSVMLLDCDRLDWDAPAIIAGLGPRYTYAELMEQLCILREDEISYSLPFAWNSLEHFDRDTRLIHYTDMLTQPWVCAANKNGWLWREELQLMLNEGSVTIKDIESEQALGYARPSLISELNSAPSGPTPLAMMQAFETEDRASGYVPHQALQKRLAKA